MEIQIEKLVFCALFAANFYDKVHGYCLRGKDALYSEQLNGVMFCNSK